MQKTKIRTMVKLSSEIGISRPTLSRFFQDPASVRPSTRTRIEDALQTVDYVPNFFATRMNHRSSGLIGIIIPNLNDPFFAGLIEAIETCALTAGYKVITQNSRNNTALEAQAARNMIAMGVDGVIMVPIGETSSVDDLSRLKRQRPMVFVDTRPQERFHDVDFIGTDNRQSRGLLSIICAVPESLRHFFECQAAIPTIRSGNWPTPAACWNSAMSRS
ncbi:LacI family DNA-binding transcriptional regulator [Hoeflea halophila]|uniref:LacI family DNA-binding transcriptional regulator n=1 Tax=Hoeflea halophila TaxID=714899 RepID=UPI00117AED00|nr:LacI family DNA-binding transcriptional regulator [Hoeflea halophila]